jgi:hypothetical protein
MAKQMTRKAFEAKAIHAMEQRLFIPTGWWGVWTDVQGPNGVRVAYSAGGGWRIVVRGKVVSRHDARTYAIMKARKLTAKAKQP